MRVSNFGRPRFANAGGLLLACACSVRAGSTDLDVEGAAGALTAAGGTAGNGSGGSEAGSAANGGGSSGAPGAAGRSGAAGTGAAGTGAAGSGGDIAPAPSGHTLTAATCVSGVETFIDAIDASAFRDVELAPAGGMAALLAELERLRSEDIDVPVRVRLAPGDYAPTDVGSGEIYVKGLERRAHAPLLIQAVDPTPNATRLGQGFNLVAASYLAFDGLTIGPAAVGAYHGSVGECEAAGSCYHDAPKPLAAQAGIHVSGTAENPSSSGEQDGHLDFTIYGRYRPAHHIVVRDVTIQNIFGDDEPSGVGAAGGGSDGIKFNQAADVWVIGSRVRQTSRHSIDNVGVHGGCFQGNVLASSGQGLGIEAKGGSLDVTFDGNVILDVRRVELGGENTDATYYWSAEEPGSPEHYAYEGRRIVARSNVIIDAREGALEFSGCHECAAVQNTVVFRAGFDRGAGGGDAVREVDSQINREGAGTDCTPLDGETLESCWGVGAYPADLVPIAGEPGESRVLGNANNTLVGNLFMTLEPLWGPELNPYNHPNASHAFGFVQVDVNYWYNGGASLEDPGDGSFLVEGPGSIYTGTTPNAAPGLAGTLGALDAANAALADDVTAALRPVAGSPLIGQADVSVTWFAGVDRSGTPRPTPPSIGALEAAR